MTKVMTSNSDEWIAVSCNQAVPIFVTVSMIAPDASTSFFSVFLMIIKNSRLARTLAGSQHVAGREKQHVLY